MPPRWSLATTTQLRQLVIAQAGLRELPVAFVVDAAGKPVIAAIESEKLPYNTVPADIIKLAEAGQVPLSTPSENYRVNAIVKLQKYPGRYLYVSRA